MFGITLILIGILLGYGYWAGRQKAEADLQTIQGQVDNASLTISAVELSWHDDIGSLHWVFTITDPSGKPLTYTLRHGETSYTHTNPEASSYWLYSNWLFGED